jgi:hypothetical protein
MESPDLNPIENLRSKLESDLKNRDCNTEEELMEVLQQGWTNIDQNYINDLTNLCLDAVKPSLLQTVMELGTSSYIDNQLWPQFVGILDDLTY